MLDNMEEVDEIEIGSNDESLNIIEPKKIYKDWSSLSLRDRLMSWNGFTLTFLSIFSSSIVLIGMIGFTDKKYLNTTYSIIVIIALFSLSMYSCYMFVLRDFMDYLHPSYYIIGEYRVLEIPSNEGEASSVVYIEDMNDFDIEGDSVLFSDSDEEVKFSLPEKTDFIEIQEEIYEIT